jgi:hypothetical protein
MQVMQDMQLKEAMDIYNGIVKNCFNYCIKDFKSADLLDDERGCIAKCGEKLMRHSQKISLTFQEHSQMLNQ